MLHKSLQQVLQSWIGALGVDELDIFCDVVYCEIFQGRDVDFGGIHGEFELEDVCNRMDT